ncbi:hypothetical protein ILUMI_27311 [Ignelater luminosus]|uniref:Reverse transcriptase n=1 Tax=Ignelater luminosus TaxID=2038154 RepID=A0A8K0C5A6_IGNLU|nr:hypothetical protein ILUMI_27311 [Ignelater luminosus]
MLVSQLICSYGFVGSSGQALYKQKFPDLQKCSKNFEATLFATTTIPLRLISLSGNILWNNQAPQSVRFCCPIKLRCAKETNDHVLKEKKSVDEEITLACQYSLHPNLFKEYCGKQPKSTESIMTGTLQFTKSSCTNVTISVQFSSVRPSRIESISCDLNALNKEANVAVPNSSSGGPKAVKPEESSNCSDTIFEERSILGNHELEEVGEGNTLVQDYLEHETEQLEEKSLKRRRKRRQIDGRTWQANSNKRKREHSKEYNGRRRVGGKWYYKVQKAAKVMKPRFKCKYRESRNSVFKCMKYSEEDRHEIFSRYWALSTAEKKLNIQLLLVFTGTHRQRSKEQKRKIKTTKVKHHIDTENSPQVSKNQYPIPYSQRKVLQKEIRTLLQAKVIEPCTSEWNAPTVMVTENLPNGSLKHRLCIDYSDLNKVTKKEIFPIPRSERPFEKAKRKPKVKYLDHIISGNGIQVDPDKLQALKSFPIPTSVKKVIEFLGLGGWYRRFINHFAHIAEPLT